MKVIQNSQVVGENISQSLNANAKRAWKAVSGTIDKTSEHLLTILYQLHSRKSEEAQEAEEWRSGLGVSLYKSLISSNRSSHL